jgi:hypothetical protein
MKGHGNIRDIDFIESMYVNGKMSANDSREYSMSPVKSPLFSIPGFNLFKMPHCRLHAWDHGIFPRMLQWCIALIEKNASDMGKKTFDLRWRETCNFPGLKSFRQGVSDLKFVKAFEHRAMSLQLPFVLHGLLDDNCALRASIAYLESRIIVGEFELSEAEVIK